MRYSRNDARDDAESSEQSTNVGWQQWHEAEQYSMNKQLATMHQMLSVLVERDAAPSPAYGEQREPPRRGAAAHNIRRHTASHLVMHCAQVVGVSFVYFTLLAAFLVLYGQLTLVELDESTGRPAVNVILFEGELAIGIFLCFLVLVPLGTYIKTKDAEVFMKQFLWAGLPFLLSIGE